MHRPCAHQHRREASYHIPIWECRFCSSSSRRSPERVVFGLQEHLCRIPHRDLSVCLGFLLDGVGVERYQTCRPWPPTVSSSGDSILANAIIKSQGWAHTELGRSLSLCLCLRRGTKRRYQRKKGTVEMEVMLLPTKGCQGP